MQTRVKKIMFCPDQSIEQGIERLDFLRKKSGLATKGAEDMRIEEIRGIPSQLGGIKLSKNVVERCPPEFVVEA